MSKFDDDFPDYYGEDLEEEYDPDDEENKDWGEYGGGYSDDDSDDSDSDSKDKDNDSGKEEEEEDKKDDNYSEKQYSGLFGFVICKTFNMAPCNQQRSTVSAIDTQITSSGSDSVAPAPKITKKKRRVRLDRLITSADGKLHVDFSSSKPIGPIGPNAKKFFNEVGIVVSAHAPLNVGKWDDIPEEQIQPLIDRVLSKFDVDISKPYVKGWMLWRMKVRFNGFQHKNARREAQDAKIMELMSKFESSNIGSFHIDQDSSVHPT
ncbi:hypothetical protein EZV62_009474 [Acer yangbiense]|uniref:Uncharacterized protein n=1 Tax=Acer yangbiense TaxID=1000413 RepID=A0A5C7HZX5_9ROSI|nr:hypothetical protein EZV62_009474 [Acer yangbiense]